MSIGEGGVAWWNIVEIYKVLAILFICWVCFFDPIGVFLWCMHSIWIAQLSILGSIHNYGGIVGSSQVMMSALKCVIICESTNGLVWGLKL